MPNQSRPPPITNHLLAALPAKVYKRLIPHLESVPLPFMDVLYKGGETIKYVYFPNAGLISMLVVMNDATLRDELKRGGALQNVLQRNAHALFTQVSQSAACVSSHALDKRLSRWLLMTHDHAPGDEFVMKHEFMAMMLGVTRSVVTRAAGRLQNEKMIRYTRGRVTVLDRRRLEATACECYGVVKAEYARSAHTRGSEMEKMRATVCHAVIARRRKTMRQKIWSIKSCRWR